MTNALSNEQLRDILILHGFKIHEGMTDLKLYVYEAVRAVLAAQAGVIVKHDFTITGVNEKLSPLERYLIAEATRDDWKEAVLDACTIACIGWDELDPRKSINDLVNWHVQVALDPKVSEAAQALIDSGAQAPTEQPKQTWAEVLRILNGIDCDQCEIDNGWWETSEGAVFGKHILAKLKEVWPDTLPIVEALRPFAALLQEHNDTGEDNRPIFGINNATITLGDLRKAKSLIKAMED